MTALSLRRPPPWTALAACDGMAAPDLDPWLADEELPEAQREQLERIATGVCWGSCTVREACLEHALATGEGSGIWGGLNPAERRALADGDPLLRRPSIHGATQHGQRSMYVAGCRCGACCAANTRYAADLRRRQRWSATSSGVLIPVRVLERPTGRGHGKAWPGQLAIAWEATAA